MDDFPGILLVRADGGMALLVRAGRDVECPSASVDDGCFCLDFTSRRVTLPHSVVPLKAMRKILAKGSLLVVEFEVHRGHVKAIREHLVSQFCSALSAAALEWGNVGVNQQHGVGT